MSEENKHKFKVWNEELLDYIKFVCEDKGFDYEELIAKMKEDSHFQEFERLVNTYNRTGLGDNFVLKIKAYKYKMKYKYTDYNIPIFKKEDYKLFIGNLY